MKINSTEAYRKIKQGGVVAIPTDTVYGLVASIEKNEAIKEIYHLKNRPLHKPLIILISDPEEILPFIKTLPEGADLLIKHFWPGALTLIFSANQLSVPSMIRADLPSIGFRIPNCIETLNLLKMTGPLASSSCNISDEKAATSLQDAEKIFGKSFPVLESSIIPTGQASTILLYKKNRWRIEREGAISQQMLKSLLTPNNFNR